jgi:hypothetical protein
MIINLPVKVYDKCTSIPFSIELNNDTITINTTNEIKIHNIILCNFSYGISIFPVSFPLTFYIVKNELICDQFYIFRTLSHQNNFDFLNIIINEINKKFNKKLTLYKTLNLMNLINVLKLHSNNDISNEKPEMIDYNKIYYRICRYLNFCIAILSEETTCSISDTSKITLIINIIKQIKINFYGNILSIEDHIEFIKNPKLIKRRKYYFYENNNKLVKIFVGDNINKQHIKPYPNKYTNLITIKNLLNTLILNNFNLLFDITSKVLYKKKQHIIIMINSLVFNTDDMIEYEISNNNYNNISKLPFNKFKLLIDNVDLDKIDAITNDLIINNIYPINFDKRSINDNFMKLIYICIKNETIIQSLNNKTKSLMINIIKLYKSLKNDDVSILYNPKIYTENIVYQITKIFLLNNINNLLLVNTNCKQIFINNILIIQILSNLTWRTISKQFSCFKYLISNKNNCKDLIIIDGKINKVFTNNMDNRLKKIILEPLLMFNYLKQEEDFYKWIFNFKELIPKIFYNMINLTNSDYKKLAKILYFYSKIQNQNMNDEYYKKLLGVLKTNNNIILFNDRINIKFKELFKQININLGFMTRDIVNEETISVTITEDIDDLDEDNEILEKINKLKRKYYKYKGKYLEIKITESVTETKTS